MFLFYLLIIFQGFDANVLRIWVFIKYVKVPNLKASLWSQSKWNGGEKRNEGEAVMWIALEAPGSLISHSRLGLRLRDHNVSRRLFVSYCCGEAGGPQHPTHSKALRR